MQYLNLIPIALLAWFVFTAWKASLPNDYQDNYFQREKSKTGRRFRNIFGVPRLD